MLDRDSCRARIERFRDGLDAGVEAAVICRPEHVLYLGNFLALPNSLNLRGVGWLVIERDGPVTLFTDNWLGGDMAPNPDETTSADAIVRTTWYDGSGPATPRVRLVSDAVSEHLKTRKIRNIAAETAFLPFRVASHVDSVIDCETRLLSLREVKDDDEIAAIRRAIATAESMHAASRDALEPGLTELEYYARLLSPGTCTAGEPYVMMGDVASGPRAARGGGAPTDRKLESGELIILDFFPYVGGYRGDITNTLVVDAEPTTEQEELFELVLGALHKAESLLEPGREVPAIRAAIEEHFAAANEKLVHHAGHAIGLGHPEAPELVGVSDRVLEAGMVLTLEPGVYGKPDAPVGGGIRLEHDYLVTDTGHERLSSHVLGLV